MRNPLTAEAMADWCEKQGDRLFEYTDSDQCASAQYARHLGMADRHWRDAYYAGSPFWTMADDIANECASYADQRPATLADLAARLRALKAA